MWSTPLTEVPLRGIAARIIAFAFTIPFRDRRTEGLLSKGIVGMTRDSLARVLSWIFWTAFVSFFGFFLGAKGSITEHGELVGASAGAVLGFAIGGAFRWYDVCRKTHNR
jgi:hypothetical protein